MSTQSGGHATLGTSVGGYVSAVSQTRPFLPIQDCAGAILYSSDRAVEVALDAMQSLGGNEYINGASSLYFNYASFLCLISSCHRLSDYSVMHGRTA